MRSLVDIIKESKNSGILVTRNNIDCADITEQDFIKALKEDIKKSLSIYKDLFNDAEEDQYKKTRDFVIKQNTPRHLFTKKSKQEWEDRQKAKLSNPFEFEYPEIFCGYWEIGQKDKSNFININSSDREYNEIYKRMSEDKYFDYIKGWNIKYNYNSKSIWFEPIFDKEIQKEYDKTKSDYEDSMINYYKNNSRD